MWERCRAAAAALAVARQLFGASTPRPPPTATVRRRCSFSAPQVRFLDAEFARSRYISAERRRAIAALLGLTQQQVKIWYQNRRYKTKTNAKKAANFDQKKKACPDDLP